MPILSAVFLILSLALAVAIGPTTTPWLWGPSLLALALSGAAAVATTWRQKTPTDHSLLLSLGAITALWFAVRAWTSPVAEFGQTDLMLIGGIVGAFVCTRAITGHPLAEKILSRGITLLLLASLVMVVIQLRHPGFLPLLEPSDKAEGVTGFFTHHNYGASFLLVSSILVMATALHSSMSRGSRWIMGAIAIAGLIAVWFTHSRGGILSAVAACAVLIILLLIRGHQRKSKWFPVAMIALPLIGLGLAGALFMGWQNAQETRFGSYSLINLLGNYGRLHLYSIAIATIATHPLIGGGARSFSWECYPFWTDTDQALSFSRPEFVHNEWLQAATDYGLIGVALVIGLILILFISSLVRLYSPENDKSSPSTDSWRIGGLAALTGICLHSCFSFLLHVFPIALLFGICLARASRPGTRATGNAGTYQKILMTAAVAGLVLTMVPSAWKGSAVTFKLWPTHYGKQKGTATKQEKVDALESAIETWPMAKLHLQKATLLHELALASDGAEATSLCNAALEDYEAGRRMHPHLPELEINRALLLSRMQLDPQASEAFELAIRLQGGMEGAFRGHHHYASHLLKLGINQLRSSETDSAVATLELAAHHAEQAAEHSFTNEMKLANFPLRVLIHEMLGLAHEAGGNTEMALESYDRAASFHHKIGRWAHLRSAMMIGKRANEVWFKRQPEQALALFIQARQRARQAHGKLPDGISETQRDAFIQQLENAIKILRSANIEPATD